MEANLPDTAHRPAGPPGVGEDSLPGISAAIQRINRTVREYSTSHGLVFLSGERGTEKSLAAKLLHHHSSRASKPLGRLRVSWKLPPELLQHAEMCREGTLVLVLQREIPIDMQYTLVEIASHGVFVDPLSGQTVDCPNMGIVLLTSQTLEELAGLRTGTVLPELKELLEARQIIIPPLRKRPEDIPALVRYAISRARETGRCKVTGADAQVLALFRHWNWPGNAEDLLLVTAQAALGASGEMISLKDLPEEFTSQIPAEELEAARQVRIPRPPRKPVRRGASGEYQTEPTATFPATTFLGEDTTTQILAPPKGVDTPTPISTPGVSAETPLYTPFEEAMVESGSPGDAIFDAHNERTPVPEAAQTAGEPEEETQTLPAAATQSDTGAMLPRRVLTLARRLGAQSQILAGQIAAVKAAGVSSEGVPKLPSQPPQAENVPATMVEEELYRGLDLVLALRRQLALLNMRQRESLQTFRDLMQRLNLRAPAGGGADPEIESEKVELARQLQSIREIIERVAVNLPDVKEDVTARADEMARMEALAESTSENIRLVGPADG